MKADFITSLIHDGDYWIASNETLTARGRTFKELYDDMGCALREHNLAAKGTTVTVFMGFDFDTIPTWIRQYGSHYFNRYVTIDV